MLKRYPTTPQTLGKQRKLCNSLANDLAVHNGDFIIDNGSDKVSYKAELSSMRNEAVQATPYRHFYSENAGALFFCSK